MRYRSRSIDADGDCVAVQSQGRRMRRLGRQDLVKSSSRGLKVGVFSRQPGSVGKLASEVKGMQGRRVVFGLRRAEQLWRAVTEGSSPSDTRQVLISSPKRQGRR